MGDGNGKAEGAKPTVFVSYSRADQKQVLPLIDLIREAGYAVWWDGMLEGGERFSRTTETVLESARAVVVFWSETSIASHWVHDEATTGRDHNCLVPLSLDGSQPPLGFRQFQTIDISRAKVRPGDPAMRGMLHAIAALHDRPPEPVAPTAKGKPQIDRRLILAGGGVLVAGGLGAAWLAGMYSSEAQGSSVAVLPFENLSGDPDQGYFADGLASEVRGALARIPQLQVVGQASSNAVRDMRGDAIAIADKLGVAFLVDGNVRRSSANVRIAAELIEGDTGISRWTETFDRPLADVFAVQSEIARAVANAITSRVQPQGYSANDPEKGGTKNVAAFDAYLRGRDIYMDKLGGEADQRALALIDQAIAIDPNYGLARATRAHVMETVAAFAAKGAERRKLQQEMVAEALRAVAIAPKCARAFTALASARFEVEFDARGARAPYARARELGGGDPDVLWSLGQYYARTGRFDEATKVLNLAATLDPLNATILHTMAVNEFNRRDYRAGIAASERALRLNPKMVRTHAIMGKCKLMLGDLAGARAAYALEPLADFRLAGFAILAWREGKKAEAHERFRELVGQQDSDNAFHQAAVLAQWGELERALDALEQGYEAREHPMVMLSVDPLLDPLRDTPRYQALRQRMGFD